MYSRIVRTSPSCLIENQKFFHTCSYLLRKRNHYDVLGITPKATAADVKQAYYKLSKEYHPDRNKDNPEAVEKFREVSESYEVIGNYNLRKLYDKGMLHTAGGQYAQAAQQEAEEEDPQTRFYRMRNKRSETPKTSGENPVYDFDAWTKNHYGKNFDRRMQERLKMKVAQERAEHRQNSLKIDKLIYAMFILMGILCTLEPMIHDIPREVIKSQNNDKK